jgi:hypothetical protein
MYRLAYWIGRIFKAARAGFRDGFAAPTKRDLNGRLARVREALDSSEAGSIVPAVKLHRELFGSTLKDAVDIVRGMKN